MSNLPRYADAVAALGGIETAISLIGGYVTIDAVVASLEESISFIVRYRSHLFNRAKILTALFYQLPWGKDIGALAFDPAGLELISLVTSFFHNAKAKVGTLQFPETYKHLSTLSKRVQDFRHSTLVIPQVNQPPPPPPPPPPIVVPPPKEKTPKRKAVSPVNN